MVRGCGSSGGRVVADGIALGNGIQRFLRAEHRDAVGQNLRVQ
jgi:hypothetical protein